VYRDLNKECSFSTEHLKGTCQVFLLLVYALCEPAFVKCQVICLPIPNFIQLIFLEHNKTISRVEQKHSNNLVILHTVTTVSHSALNFMPNLFSPSKSWTIKTMESEGNQMTQNQQPQTTNISYLLCPYLLLDSGRCPYVRSVLWCSYWGSNPLYGYVV